MSQYPTVYNQNSGDGDDKEGRGISMDMGFDDDSQQNPTHSEYADGEDDDELSREVEKASK